MDSEARYPIREVSRITGVNPVTLRAWQRRYGLIKPARTESGHRLYDDADIERIRRILAWLDKGVSIGQVKALLEDATTAVSGDGWHDKQQELLKLSSKLDLNRLAKSIDEYAKTYPGEHWLRHIIESWLRQLAALDRVDRELIEQSSRRLLGQRIERMISIRTGPRVALLQAGNLTTLDAQLARYELQGLECRALDLGHCPLAQLPLALDRLSADACVIQLGPGLNASAFQNATENIEIPCFYFGIAGNIYQQRGWLQYPFATTLNELRRHHEAAFTLV
jgi:DNA-binding transcriptional MerR regulator